MASNGDSCFEQSNAPHGISSDDQKSANVTGMSWPPIIAERDCGKGNIAKSVSVSRWDRGN